MQTNSSTTASQVWAFAYKFTGKERDAESGLDYFGARYYSSNMGRFSSPDPGWFLAASLDNPQTWNQYSYALNNPLKYTDPTGLYCYYGSTSADVGDDSQYDMHSTQGECTATDENGNKGQWVADPSASVTVTANDNNPRDDSYSGTFTDTSLIPLNNNDPTQVTTTRTFNNPGARGQPDATQLPNCYKVEADVVVGDLNPFSPGWSTATGLAGDAAATGSAYKATQAAIYAGTKINTKGGIGLISPLKSSTYRGIMAESSLLGKVSGVLFWGSLDVSLGRAVYAAVTTPCK